MTCAVLGERASQISGFLEISALIVQLYCSEMVLIYAVFFPQHFSQFLLHAIGLLRVAILPQSNLQRVQRGLIVCVELVCPPKMLYRQMRLALTKILGTRVDIGQRRLPDSNQRLARMPRARRHHPAEFYAPDPDPTKPRQIWDAARRLASSWPAACFGAPSAVYTFARR